MNTFTIPHIFFQAMPNNSVIRGWAPREYYALPRYVIAGGRWSKSCDEVTVAVNCHHETGFTTLGRGWFVGRINHKEAMALITKRAKWLREKDQEMTWNQAVSQASRDYRKFRDKYSRHYKFTRVRIDP